MAEAIIILVGIVLSIGVVRMALRERRIRKIVQRLEPYEVTRRP